MKVMIYGLLAFSAFAPATHAAPLFYDRVNIGSVQFLKDDADPKVFYQLPEHFETYLNKWASDQGSLGIWVRARAVYNEKAAAELQKKLRGSAAIVRLQSKVEAELTKSASELFEDMRCEEAPATELSCVLVIAKKAERVVPQFRAGHSITGLDALFTVEAIDSFGKLSRYEHASPVRVSRPAQR